MCGIVGIWSHKGREFHQKTVSAMNEKLIHRGPDGSGIWISPNESFSFGHRRLSIIDLTENGKQPMHYLDRYTITYNGEVYNYLEIREILIQKGYQFKSQTDTEVILAAYHEYGISCIQHFEGMFAFAIYDKDNDTLFCARDRFGEKPFYYCFYENDFYFASEMKAIWEAGVPKIQSENMMYNFLALDLVENPLDLSETFYTNIKKLRSAHYFIFKNGTKSETKYWNLDISKSLEFTETEISNTWYELFDKSIKHRLRSDVKMGTSLSGGLDSSSVVAMVSKYQNQNHTFSARFKNFIKDEGEYIHLVKNKFNTIHHDVYIDSLGLLENMDKLIYHQEEPFQTGSIYAQYCVYKEARKAGIPVMLDGQGADEYLCGYDKDFPIYLKEIYFNRILNKEFSNQIKSNHGLNLQVSFLDKLHTVFPSAFAYLSVIKQHYFPKQEFGIDINFHNSNKKGESLFPRFNSLKEMLQYELTVQGLEKLLKFADRNSMAHSVEVRLPFLNHKLIEYTMSLSAKYFLQDGWSKAILRNAMQNELPNEIVRRRDKIGFEAPSAIWASSSPFKELIYDAKARLIKNKYITAHYSNEWKIYIANKFIQS